MKIDSAIALTQDRLLKEGESMGELLGWLKNRISPALIGESEWEQVLECASRLPVTMGAQPFGFEIPLHSSQPRADFGVSLASGNHSGAVFEARARSDKKDKTANAVSRLFREIDAPDSPLREIVGRKLMLEYDIGPKHPTRDSQPGFFLRPNERALVAGSGLRNDVGVVVNALVSCLNMNPSSEERQNAERVYLAQPGDTRLDSFGIFPSRERTIRLAVMGFTSQQQICSYLKAIGWPGQVTALVEILSRLRERAKIEKTGVNIDVKADGIGPVLGLTPIVKQRFTNDPRIWIDGLTEWHPLLDALAKEEMVVQEKLTALKDWNSKPAVLFAKTGRFVLMSGIHHVKLVLSENRLLKIKAYLYMVLSGAIKV